MEVYSITRVLTTNILSIALTYTPSSQVNELEELIQGCMRNERNAQERLYKLFYPKMLYMVKRYIDDTMQAEEVMNNGYLRAFQKIDQYNFKGSFEGWLRKIIFHAVSDYVKQNTKYSNHVLLVEKDEYVNKEQSDKLHYEQLLKLVQGLPDSTRTVFNMYVMDGFTHREIAKMLGISEGTSKWHLSEGRKILKEKVEKLQLNNR